METRQLFSFELSWLSLDRFREIVAHEWAAISAGTTPIEVWKNKIKHLHQFLRGWARDRSSSYKKERDHLLSIIDILDRKAESTLLMDSERDTLRNANDKVAESDVFRGGG